MVFIENLRSQNYLLTSLSDEIYQRLAPDLQVVSLKSRQVLFELGVPIDAVYFPTQSLISLGFDRFITKPITDLQQFVATIAELIANP